MYIFLFITKKLFSDNMKIEYNDIVKTTGLQTLYTSIPKKLADKEGIIEGDNVRVTVEKIGGKP